MSLKFLIEVFFLHELCAFCFILPFAVLVLVLALPVLTTSLAIYFWNLLINPFDSELPLSRFCKSETTLICWLIDLYFPIVCLFIARDPTGELNYCAIQTPSWFSVRGRFAAGEGRKGERKREEERDWGRRGGGKRDKKGGEERSRERSPTSFFTI